MKLGSVSAESAKYRNASTSRATPATTASGMRAGRLVMGVGSGSGDEEDHGAQRSGDRAVDGERGEAVGLEEAHEEPHGQVGGHGRRERADQRGPAHVVPLAAGEVGQLQRG